MPETNIVVSLLDRLLDRAKGLMAENRNSLNNKQQDAKTLEKSTRRKEEEGKRRRNPRRILRPTAIGVNGIVANGFTYQKHTIRAAGLPGNTLTSDKDNIFRIYSGDGEVFAESVLPARTDSFSGSVSTYDEAIGMFRGITNSTTFSTRGALLDGHRSFGQARGSFDAIGLPVQGRTYVHIILARDWVQFHRIVTETGGGGTTQSVSKTPFIEAYLVGEASVRQIPLPEGLAQRLLDMPYTPYQTSSDGVTSVNTPPEGEPIVDYAGFLASSYGLGAPWETLGTLDANQIWNTHYPGIGWELETVDRTDATEHFTSALLSPESLQNYNGYINYYGPFNLYFSPGIYQVIQRSPQEWRDIQNVFHLRAFQSEANWETPSENPYTLEDAESFLASTGEWGPTGWLLPCINNGTCEPGVIGYNAARSLVNVIPGDEATTNIDWGRSDIRPNQTAWRPNPPVDLDITSGPPDYFVPGFSWQTMHVWDGNQPAYCRSKLIELGFTEEDLTP
jgi:hypothetical protein